MRYVIIIALTIVALGACALHESSTTQPICTQEDIDNGTCGDPGGGSPPSPQASGSDATWSWALNNTNVSSASSVGSISCQWTSAPGQGGLMGCHFYYTVGPYTVHVGCGLQYVYDNGPNNPPSIIAVDCHADTH